MTKTQENVALWKEKTKLMNRPRNDTNDRKNKMEG